MLFDKHYNKELKIYDCFGYLGDKERKINEELHGENYSIAKKFSWHGVVLDIVKSIGKAISMLVTIFLIIYKNVGISAFTVLVQAMDSIQDGLKNVFSKIKDFGASFLAFDDYRKFCELKDEAETFKPVLADESKPIIEFKDVSFGYPTKPNALKEINLKINAGEKIAVVGKNGSGKTTLINTLLGFYKPVNGEILIMGTPLNDCLSDFRNRTIYIMQNVPRYSASIEDNVRLGRELVNEYIAEVLDIDSIIDKAPHKEQTLLGEENEDRYNISGGEWSKLGIMRNSQKKKPFLYIMDEPTAALDPIAESNIFESFHQITDSKTSIFISHRLGMTKLADRIVVLDNGMIAEQGSHDELMHLKGLYYEMYTEQLNLYKR
jgi:ABC-type multidrug transport system fused ATPase/permease subunit